MKFLGPFFHKKVPFLANIECSPKFLEYAQPASCESCVFLKENPDRKKTFLPTASYSYKFSIIRKFIAMSSLSLRRLFCLFLVFLSFFTSHWEITFLKSTKEILHVKFALKLVPLFFVKFLFFHQMIALQKI